MSMQLVAAILEFIFILTVLAILGNQRGRVGVAPVLMVFATVMFFGTLMCASEVTIKLFDGFSFDLAPVSIFLPLLTAFLMIYIVFGVLKAQRLLLGIMCAFLLYIYFVMMIKLHCSNMEYGALRDVVMILISQGSASVNLNAVSNLLSLLTVPVFYSLQSRRIWRTLRIMTALYAALAVGAFPEAVLLLINKQLAEFPWQSYAAVFACTPVAAFMLSFFLVVFERDIDESKISAFDFIFAFFGSYSRVKELEDDLVIWRSRYRQVMLNTAEVVIMTDRNGNIIEANNVSARVFRMKNPAMLIGRNLFSLFIETEPAEINWQDAEKKPLYFDSVTAEDKDGKRIISASLSPVNLKKQLIFVLVARDVTGLRRLEKEKDELSEQLMHSQRMESLGMLAGGIAHDFNNCIHAIIGHADVAEMLCAGNPEKVSGHLKKIILIAEKAGNLTSQLLGFARKGKYNVADVDLIKMLDGCSGLLDPYRVRGVDIRISFDTGPLIIRGDAMQIQQVILNLLINALDATAENEDIKRIELRAGRAVDAPLKFSVPADRTAADPADYLYISVRDNGTGMDEETRKKIFEPFFTTKPIGSGTGMGLAMVYGTVTHHNGWIQVSSTLGIGTEFCLFFPESKKEE